MEVDTKPAELIVEEFAEFSRRYGPVFHQLSNAEQTIPESEVHSGLEEPKLTPVTPWLGAVYNRYACVLAGKTEPVGEEWTQDTASLHQLNVYRSVYLPHEILHWGGEVEDMFVESCRQLSSRDISLDGFVAFWFREPRPFSGTYDFFLLKVDRFVEFVHEVAPELHGIAEREAEELRCAYCFANEPGIHV